jgi:hypothetical protein
MACRCDDVALPALADRHFSPHLRTGAPPAPSRLTSGRRPPTKGALRDLSGTPSPYAASWKMIPSVTRSPDSTVATP